jgi:L-lactate dehydrogenase
MQTGLASEIAIVDVDPKRVEGEVMDLSHGLPFLPPVNVKAGSYQDCADAALIVVTAGAKQTPGQSRLELINKNARIVADICQNIKKFESNAVFLMVTNPVDTLTHVAVDTLGWNRKRILGSGTVLDSARFRFLLSKHCAIDPHNIHAYILGEHGDSELAAWSMTHLAGIQITDYCKTCAKCDWKKEHKKIAQQVKDSAYHIIDYKGSTYYGIGLSLIRISAAVLRDEHSVLTVSSLIKGEYGLDNVCISVPSVVSAKGIDRIITAPLNRNEITALKASAKTLSQVYNSISLK